MIDFWTAKIEGHRRNIQRYIRLLATELTEFERANAAIQAEQESRNRVPPVHWYSDPAAAEGEIGFEQALELQKGLVIECDVVDIGEGGSAGLEAILDGEGADNWHRTSCVETFFLRGGHDATIDDQCGRTVVIERGNSSDSHERSVRTGCR